MCAAHPRVRKQRHLSHPVLGEPLNATARGRAQEQDRRARDTYEAGQAALAEICQMPRAAPIDAEDNPHDPAKVGSVGDRISQP